MANFLVSGLINIETTLRVSGFPIEYNPVNYPFFGIRTSLSGVGYNVARALTCLDNKVTLLSIVGHDLMGQRAIENIRRDTIDVSFVIAKSAQTPQSVILYDGDGRRQIHVDLKDIQDQEYPLRRFQQAILRADQVVLCNVNFSRPLLAEARQAGKPIYTDVHALSDLNDDYNRDFMQHADVLFMSAEKLPVSAEEFGREVMDCYHPRVLVIGRGSQGALLFTAETPQPAQVPAVVTRPIVNTVGAGDALFAAFAHCYADGADPLTALRKAVVFASYKIGAATGSEGYLDHRGLGALYNEVRARFEPAS
jgi:ribokinase